MVRKILSAPLTSTNPQGKFPAVFSRETLQNPEKKQRNLSCFYCFNQLIAISSKQCKQQRKSTKNNNEKFLRRGFVQPAFFVVVVLSRIFLIYQPSPWPRA